MPCLISLSQTPYGSKTAKESLDLALVLAAFEQQPAVLFLDDGVLQLLPACNSPASHKHIGKIISALEIYDISELWVEQESLDLFSLLVSDLSQKVNVIPRAKVSLLFSQYEQHLVF
jgi:tRNA 2-thiouridine synthesizing protein C